MVFERLFNINNHFQQWSTRSPSPVTAVIVCRPSQWDAQAQAHRSWYLRLVLIRPVGNPEENEQNMHNCQPFNLSTLSFRDSMFWKKTQVDKSQPPQFATIFDPRTSPPAPPANPMSPSSKSTRVSKFNEVIKVCQRESFTAWNLVWRSDKCSKRNWQCWYIIYIIKININNNNDDN